MGGDQLLTKNTNDRSHFRRCHPTVDRRVSEVEQRVGLRVCPIARTVEVAESEKQRVTRGPSLPPPRGRTKTYLWHRRGVGGGADKEGDRVAALFREEIVRCGEEGHPGRQQRHTWSTPGKEKTHPAAWQAEERKIQKKERKEGQPTGENSGGNEGWLGRPSTPLRPTTP